MFGAGFTLYIKKNNYSRMKIALIGYGKMGKVIERIALERGHEWCRVLQAGSMRFPSLQKKLRQKDIRCFGRRILAWA
ncbi:MAG: hypothetical protein H6Q20_549 [Bacteroidetes bacterium]|nr:hypothetical protein [Bacteroidota bacterium]